MINLQNFVNKFDHLMRDMHLIECEDFPEAALADTARLEGARERIDLIAKDHISEFNRQTACQSLPIPEGVKIGARFTMAFAGRLCMTDVGSPQIFELTGIGNMSFQYAPVEFSGQRALFWLPPGLAIAFERMSDYQVSFIESEGGSTLQFSSWLNRIEEVPSNVARPGS